MRQLSKLFESIADAPDSDGPRLELADWYEQNGLVERATYLRTCVAEARLPLRDPARVELNMLALQLLPAVEREVLNGHGKALVTFEFERGLIDRAVVTVEGFIAHGEELLRVEYVRRILFVDETGTYVQGRVQLRTPEAAAAFAQLRFPNLRQLRVSVSFGMEPALMHSLLISDGFSSLKALAFQSDQAINDRELLRQLVDGRVLPHLRWLAVSGLDDQLPEIEAVLHARPALVLSTDDEVHLPAANPFFDERNNWP